MHVSAYTSVLTGTNIFSLFFLFSSLLGVWCFSELFFVKEPQDVTVSRKDPVVLDCQARGEAPITITWLKNGGKVSENERIYTLSNGSLYISEVEGKKGELSDEGFYQCLALNKHGAILSQKSHLTLASKSQLLFFNLFLSLWQQFSEQHTTTYHFDCVPEKLKCKIIRVKKLKCKIIIRVILENLFFFLNKDYGKNLWWSLFQSDVAEVAQAPVRPLGQWYLVWVAYVCH